MEIMLDTTIGVGFIFYIFHVLLVLLESFNVDIIHLVMIKHEQGSNVCKQTGGAYVKQVTFFLIVVTIMKLLMVLLIFLLAHPLRLFGEWMFSCYIFTGSYNKLIFVMVITPLIMNSLQFWGIDNIFIDAWGRRIRKYHTPAVLGYIEKLSLLNATISESVSEHEASLQVLSMDLAAGRETLDQLTTEIAQFNEAKKELIEEDKAITIVLTKEQVQKFSRLHNELRNLSVQERNGRNGMERIFSY